MSELDFLWQEVYRRYGAVRRARGAFLYTAKGVRLTDLYQENGRAILGWGGGRHFTVLKDVLARGITGSYTTGHSHRLSKAVSRLLGSPRTVLAFGNKQDLLSVALQVAPQSTAFYVPWAQSAPDWATVQAVGIKPPLAWAGGTMLLAVLDTVENEAKLALLAHGGGLGGMQRLAPPLEAAYTRSVYDLIAALGQREEKHWFVYDRSLVRYWRREGPYLFPKVPQERYRDFVGWCLDCAVVPSPLYEVPSIVPFGADKGVFSQMDKNPFGGWGDAAE